MECNQSLEQVILPAILPSNLWRSSSGGSVHQPHERVNEEPWTSDLANQLAKLYFWLGFSTRALNELLVVTWPSSLFACYHSFATMKFQKKTVEDGGKD